MNADVSGEDVVNPLDDYRSTLNAFREMKVQYQESAVRAWERRIAQLIPPDKRSREIHAFADLAPSDEALASIAGTYRYPTDAFSLHEMVAGGKAFAWHAFPEVREVTATVPFLGYRHGYLQAVMLADQDPPIVALDSIVVSLYSHTLARTILLAGDSEDIVDAKRNASVELLRFGWTRDPQRLTSAMRLLDEAGLAIGDESGVFEWYYRSTTSEFCHYIISFFVLHEIGHVVQAKAGASGFGALDGTAECEELADRFAMQCIMNVLIPRSTDAAMIAARAVSELFLTLAIRDQLARPAIGPDHASWDRRWSRLHDDLAQAGIMAGLQSHVDRSHTALLTRAQRARASDLC